MKMNKTFYTFAGVVNLYYVHLYNKSTFLTETDETTIGTRSAVKI